MLPSLFIAVKSGHLNRGI